MWSRFLCWLGFHEYRYVNIPGKVVPAYMCMHCGFNPYASN